MGDKRKSIVQMARTKKGGKKMKMSGNVHTMRAPTM